MAKTLEPDQFFDPPLLLGSIVQARKAYRNFIERMRISDGGYLFTASADATPFSLCFALFGLHLLGDSEILQRNARLWAEKLRSWVREYRDQRQNVTDTSIDKPFLQLLTFTLSALAVLNMLEDDPLEDLVSPLALKTCCNSFPKHNTVRGRIKWVSA